MRRAIHAFSLASLLEEFMESKDSMITYHKNGSRVRGIGGYCVQGITIDGIY